MTDIKKPVNIFDRIAEKSAVLDDNKEAQKYLKNRKPNYPSEASPEQVATLKAKLDKHRYIHGETKPKRTLRNTVVYDGSKPEGKPFVKKPISQPQNSNKPIPRLPHDYKPYVKEKRQSLEEYLISKRKKEYGLNQNLISERLAIANNIDWVLGRNRNSKRKKNENNKEKGNND